MFIFQKTTQSIFSKCLGISKGIRVKIFSYPVSWNILHECFGYCNNLHSIYVVLYRLKNNVTFLRVNVRCCHSWNQEAFPFSVCYNKLRSSSRLKAFSNTVLCIQWKYLCFLAIIKLFLNDEFMLISLVIFFPSRIFNHTKKNQLIFCIL